MSTNLSGAEQKGDPDKRCTWHFPSSRYYYETDSFSGHESEMEDFHRSLVKNQF